MQLEERFYTSTEVAQILGVSLRSVYRYLEEDKITADVKTATGRHRFTKQNILDFLYPEGQPAPKKAKTTDTAAQASPEVVEEAQSTEEGVQPTDQQEQESPTEESSGQTSEPEVTPDASTEQVSAEAQEQPKQTTEEQVPQSATEDDKSVDWLSKFKAAAEKYKEEQQAAAVQSPQPSQTAPQEPEQQTQQSAAAPAPTQTAVETKAESVAGLVDETPEKEEETVTEFYYRSGVGGLKDIAQGLDKAAKKSNVNYAFTMSAGLSLHKPIKPFSLLHAYVKGSDRDFYEKSLQLTPTSKETAQLCLMISDDASLYSSIVEMHGLNVVSNAQLRADLTAAGESDLVKELDA